jgi:hypothetical protein
VIRLEDPPRTHSDPSRPGKRALVALVSLIGAAVAARLAAFQMGWTGPPWEPFFGDGTRRVLESSFSRALPFPDAGLGVIAYVAEAIAVSWGGAARQRRRSPAVFVYAAIAASMAMGSAGLVLLQVAVVGALCTLCLFSALLSFVLVVPAAFELAATWRARQRR